MAEALANPLGEVSPVVPLITEGIRLVTKKVVSDVEVGVSSRIAPVEEAGRNGSTADSRYFRNKVDDVSALARKRKGVSRDEHVVVDAPTVIAVKEVVTDAVSE